MPSRALVVHPSTTAVAEIRDVLAQHVTVDASHTEVDAIRRLGNEEYAVVIIDYKPPLDAKRIAAETVAAQPDAFIVMMTPDLDSGRELDQTLSSKVFRFLAGPDQRWQLTGIVAEGLRLQKLERDQKELIKKLSLEYGKLEKREKLLDVGIKGRRRELQDADLEVRGLGDREKEEIDFDLDRKRDRNRAVSFRVEVEAQSEADQRDSKHFCFHARRTAEIKLVVRVPCIIDRDFRADVELELANESE